MQTLVFHAYRDNAAKSSALVFAARYLASLGHTVAVLDLDLEAPCMHYRLLSESERAQMNGGLIDDLSHFAQHRELSPEPRFCQAGEAENQPGKIILMPAGNAPKGSFFQSLAALRKSNFFHGDHAAIVPLLLELKEKFESQFSPSYLFIDTHSGVSELGGIALAVLADTALCFIDDTRESLDGTGALVHGLSDLSRLPGQDALQILPVTFDFPGECASQDELAKVHAALASQLFDAASPPVLRPPIGLVSRHFADGLASSGTRFGPLLRALFPDFLDSLLHGELERISRAMMDDPEAALHLLEALVERIPHPAGYRVLLQFYRFKGQFTDKTLLALHAYCRAEPKPDSALVRFLAQGCLSHGLQSPTLASWARAQISL